METKPFGLSCGGARSAEWPGVRRPALLLIALAATLLSGCGVRQTRVEIGDREQILHLGNGTEPQDLDPQIVTGVPENNILLSLFEGLVTPDPKTLKPRPGVAKSWEVSSNGLIYTFHLRHEDKWSNGQSLNAHDFIQSYHRILLPALASEYAYMLYAVKNAEAFNKGKIKDFSKVGFRAPDDYTLQVELAHPTPYFLSLVMHYSWDPVPISVIKKFGKLDQRGTPWTRPGNLVGNGPFYLKEWRMNEVIVVAKNTNYWDAAHVRLKEIHFYPIVNADTEERAFRSGQLHLDYDVPIPMIAVYKRKHPSLLHIDPYLGTYFYRINVTRPALRDPRVRRALAMAINRVQIVRDVTKGGQLPAYCFTPPNTAGYTCNSKLPTDIAAAQKLLAQAGYPDGKGFPTLNLLYNTMQEHQRIAEAIQQMWQKNLHIHVQLLNEEWKVYLSSQQQLNYDICRAGWIGDYDDPNSFLNMFVTNGGNNQTGWSNPEYDRLIEEANQTGNEAKRFALFQKAEAILLKEAPIIPIYFYTRVYLLKPSVKGWHSNLLDEHPYKYVYLQPPQ